MKNKQTYQVKEVSELSGVSVRTLHHYEAIGLLLPKGRTRAGYRLYDQDDLLRLQQILIGRESGMALEQIARYLDDPEFDRKRALLQQRERLEQRAIQTADMIRAVEAALALVDERWVEETAQATNKPKEVRMKQLFEGFDPSQYEPETKARWGNTDAYKESTRRTKQYTAEDWKRFQIEQSEVYGEVYATLQSGKPNDSTEAMNAAEKHRLLIDRWFYPCSHELHVGLSQMYEADPRFAENIDKHGAGLTSFLSAAIRANAARG